MLENCLGYKVITPACCCSHVTSFRRSARSNELSHSSDRMAKSVRFNAIAIFVCVFLMSLSLKQYSPGDAGEQSASKFATLS